METKDTQISKYLSTIRLMTDQIAKLVWERDELKKQLQIYEKHGVTCQTYRHAIDNTCSECNTKICNKQINQVKD